MQKYLRLTFILPLLFISTFLFAQGNDTPKVKKADSPIIIAPIAKQTTDTPEYSFEQGKSGNKRHVEVSETKDWFATLLPLLIILIFVIIISFFKFINDFVKIKFLRVVRDNWKVDLFTPIIVFTSYKFLYYGIINYPQFSFSNFFNRLIERHNLRELLLIFITYYVIIFYKLAKENTVNNTNIKKDICNHWITYWEQLITMNQSLFALNTSDFQNFFLPDGIRYFIHQIECINKKSTSDPNFKAKRVIVINCDKKKLDQPIVDTWINSAINNLSHLPDEFKKFKNLIQFHLLNNFDLYLITDTQLIETIYDILFPVTPTSTTSAIAPVQKSYEAKITELLIAFEVKDFKKLKSTLDLLLFDKLKCYFPNENKKLNIFHFEEVTGKTVKGKTYKEIMEKLEVKFCIPENSIKSIMTKFNITSVY